MRRSEKPVSGGEAKYAALYARVSTQDQGTRFSLPSQLKALREKAAREGYSVREDFIFVDKHTGKVASRPEFDRMNALVKTGAVGAVLIFSVDRFARRTEDALRLSREYKHYGVKLDFVEMFLEDTPVGRFTFTQLAAFSELWGEKIAADSARGRKQKLESGKLTHGSACYGYTYISKDEKDGARLEIDPAKATVVQDVFRWRIEGATIYGIAKRLNDAGILSAGFISKKHPEKSRPPGRWSRTTVYQMLRNSSYAGKHVCSGIEVACPRIIDDETFRAARRMNDENRKRLVGRPSTQYLLRGFLWCAKCGRRCTTFPNGGYAFYRCNNVKHQPYRRICFAPQVTQKAIEAAAWNEIWKLLKNPALLLSMGQAYYDALAKPEDNSAEGLERETARLMERIKVTRQMMRDSAIGYAEGLAAIREDEKRVRRIGEELAAAGRVVSLPPLRAAEAALREITAGSEPKTYERRRDILEGIVDLKMKYLEGNLEIEGKVPVRADAPASAGGGKKNCHRRVGADAQCQREHHHGREARIAGQGPEGIPQVLE
jgi:site-specific DNA recombinase